MKKTGQLLREAREARGISLQEVSVQLKINSRILRALEEGDTSQLPAKTFLRGFVQSYAQYLRIDGNGILEVFQAEMGTTHPKMVTKQVELPEEPDKGNIRYVPPEPALDVTKKPTSPQEVKVEELLPKPIASSLSVDQKTWSHSMKIVTVLGILVLAGIIIGVIKTIERYEREAKVVPPPISDLQAVPRSENSPLITPIASLTPDEATPEAAVEVTAKEEGDSKEAVKPETKTEGEVSAATTPVANPSPTPVASVVPVVEAVKARPQEVIIEALDKVVVEYSIDDKEKATIVMSPDKVHTFRAEKKILLGFSDGGSVNVIHNGKDKGVPGTLGKPLKLNFPE